MSEIKFPFISKNKIVRLRDVTRQTGGRYYLIIHKRDPNTNKITKTIESLCWGDMCFFDWDKILSSN